MARKRKHLGETFSTESFTKVPQAPCLFLHVLVPPVHLLAPFVNHQCAFSTFLCKLPRHPIQEESGEMCIKIGDEVRIWMYLFSSFPWKQKKTPFSCQVAVKTMKQEYIILANRVYSYSYLTSVFTNLALRCFQVVDCSTSTVRVMMSLANARLTSTTNVAQPNTKCLVTLGVLWIVPSRCCLTELGSARAKLL